MKCPYCDIIKGDYENIHKIFENNEIIAVLIPEIVAGHIMILPKSHITVGIKADEELYNGLFTVAQKLVKDFKNTKIYDSFSILCNTGIDQPVPHLSVHIIPRNEGDDVGLTWTPKNIGDAELDEVAARLRGEVAGNEVVKEKVDTDNNKKTKNIDKKSADLIRKQIRRIP